MASSSSSVLLPRNLPRSAIAIMDATGPDGSKEIILRFVLRGVFLCMSEKYYNVSYNTSCIFGLACYLYYNE